MDTRINAQDDLVLQCCLALRQARTEDARSALNKLLQSVNADKQQAADAECGILLKQLETCLATAIRKQQGQLAAEWLVQLQPQLRALLEQAPGRNEAGELLLNLSFAICDRRKAELQGSLQGYLRAWVRALLAADADVAALNRLQNELLSLAARMARRGWREETSFLLRQAVWVVLKANSMELWQSTFSQLALHFAVYARWDGFPKACAAYPELVWLELLAVRRAGSKRFSEDARAAYLLLAVRTLRDLIANVARAAMQDDMDIFRQWYQFLWQLAGENAVRKGRLLLLLQLAISYWQGTRPKTSKKQLRFLQDLLNPSLITEEYARLLQKII